MAEHSLEDLFRDSTVRVIGPRPGTGFFVAPGVVLTCAHVVGRDAPVSVLGRPATRVERLCDRGRPLPALDEDYPDVAIVWVDIDGHPCVALDEARPIWDDSFQTYGFPTEGGSAELLTPAMLDYRGTKGPEATPFIDLKSDTVKPGMSGGALLNLRTLAVCGLVVATRRVASPDGGLAVPWDLIAKRIPDVVKANLDFHVGNGRWSAAVARFVGTRSTPTLPGCLPRIWNVPYRSYGNFVGRARLLDALESTSTSEPIISTQAITGLGGVGKTQLAVEYAYLHCKRFDVVWWIRAEDPLSLKADFADLASALGLGNDMADLENRAAVARQWLEHHARWLLVLDNAKNAASVADVVPRGGGGRVLITSQARDWYALAEAVVVVDVLDPETAEEFLCRRSGRSEPEPARELAAELGWLPLALEQAGAVVARDPALSIRGYLDLFRDRAAELLLLGAPLAHPDPVATTWDLAVRRTAEASPAASDLLRLMAFLHPDDIPLSLLGPAEAVSHELDPIAGDFLALHEATTTLADYSLLREASGEAIAIHRLVQAVIRDRLDGEELVTCAAVALRLVARSFAFDIDDPGNWKKAARLMPHVQAVASHIDRLGDEPGGTAKLATGTGRELVSLLNRAAKFLLRSGQRMSAVALAEANAERAARLLDTKDRETLRTEAVVALAYQQAGMTDEAIILGREVLERISALLGDDDIDTVRSRADLAVSYQWARSPQWLKVAIDLGRQARDQRKRLLEAAHMDFLWSQSELSWSYSFVGRDEDALELREEVRAKRREIVGNDHPAALWDNANVAMSYESLGRSKDALHLFKEVRDARSRVLGPDHPDTVWTMARLGNAYRAVGKTEDATRVGEAAVEDSERILPQDHPDTLWARSLLARTHRSAGRTDDAINICAKVVAARQHVLGSDHLDTITANDELACTYWAAGRLDEALVIMELVLSERERILGSGHPDTVATRRRLDGLRAELGAVG